MAQLAQINSTGKRILVVDDDLAIRVLLNAVLKRLGFEVELAEDGESALLHLRSKTFDLILIDLMMPRMNGYEFIAHASRLDPPPAHMIVFTAAGQRGVDRIPDGRVCDSILKPFDLEKFVDMVTSCVDGSHEGLSQSDRSS
jgi:CheY-like chemotaxis protein